MISFIVITTCIALFSTTVEGTENDNCPDGWYFYQRRQRCFLFDQNPLIWTQAQERCKEYGGHLTTIPDEETNEFLKGVIYPSCAEYWIGLHDRFTEGVFQWLDQHNRANVSFWAAGEPNSNGDEDCVCISAGRNNKWNDAFCGMYFGYSCEQAATNSHSLAMTEPVKGTSTTFPETDTSTTAPVIDTLTTSPVRDWSTTTPQVGTTCANLQGNGQKITWINLWPDHPAVEAVCEFPVGGLGWTVIQRRQDGSVNFTRTWKDYKDGFGSLEGNFWYGLEKIRAIVDSKPHEIRFDMKTNAGVRKFAEYQNFWFDIESKGYRMRVGSFSGGDARDSFTYHNNSMFYTYDSMLMTSVCPEWYKGGFWYSNCHHCNPNGVYGSTSYGQGINWRLLTGYEVSLPFIEMKVRPMS